jgi:hypothetical protein
MRTAFNKPLLLLAGVALLPTIAVLIVGGTLIARPQFYPFLFLPEITWRVILCLALPGLMLIGLMVVMCPSQRPFIPWRLALTALLVLCVGIWLVGWSGNPRYMREVAQTRFKGYTYRAVLTYYNEWGPEAVVRPSIVVFECEPSGLFCEGLSTHWEGRRTANEVHDWEGHFTNDLDDIRLLLYVNGALAFFKEFPS